MLQTDLDEVLLTSGSVQALLQSPWSAWGQCWLNALGESLPPASGYEMTLLLTDNAKIQSFNSQFRHQDQPTDVLAFAALEGSLPRSPLTDVAIDVFPWSNEPLYLGDIVISLEQAAQQANERGHDFFIEVIWLFSHGLLHLLGWDHPDETTLTTMLSKQSYLLTLIDLNPPNFI
jgi:probable rRNA maturation factor